MKISRPPYQLENILARRAATIYKKWIDRGLEEIVGHSFSEEAIKRYPVLAAPGKLVNLLKASTKVSSVEKGEAKLAVDLPDEISEELFVGLEYGNSLIEPFGILRNAAVRTRQEMDRG